MEPKDVAKTIRNEYKSRGWSRKDISVRTTSGSIRVELLNPGIPLVEAKRIAKAFEEVRRDGYGEILLGGNLFVDVSQSDKCREGLAADLLPEVKQALEGLQPDSQHGIEIQSRPGYALFSGGNNLVKIGAPDGWGPYYYHKDDIIGIAAWIAESSRVVD